MADKDQAEKLAAEPAGHAPLPAEAAAAIVDEPAGAGDVAARARRGGGPRQNISEPVVFHFADQAIEGWTLNVSRGGLRAVVEIPLPVGANVVVTVGDSTPGRPARVVWSHEERGGAVLGLSFLDHPEPTSPPTRSTPPMTPEGLAKSSPPRTAAATAQPAQSAPPRAPEPHGNPSTPPDGAAPGPARRDP